MMYLIVSHSSEVDLYALEILILLNKLLWLSSYINLELNVCKMNTIPIFNFMLEARKKEECTI